MKTISACTSVCALTLIAVAHPASAQITLNSNILQNPGADASAGATDEVTFAPVPGWAQAGNVSAVAYGSPGFLAVASPGSPARGANLFSSGPSGGGSTLSQEVDLRPLRETILAGGTVAQFSAWLGGVGTNSGTVSLTLELLDSSYNLLSTTTLEAVTPAERGGISRMLQRRTDLPVPAPARLARVKMNFSGNVDGKSGLADDVRFVLSAPAAAPSGMTHRWSFFTLPGAVADGTVIPDTIGTAHATVRGAGATAASSFGPGKALRLPGGSSATAAYVDLPNGLVSSQTQLTVEGWYNLESFSGFWTRFFEFGTGTAGEITGPGGTAATGTNSLIAFVHTANALTQQGLHWNDPAILPDGYFQALTNSPQTLGVPSHVVYTFDNSTPGSTAITYYRDGVLKTSATVAQNLSAIADVNSWLGRSNWTNEPNLNGTLDEVRLYNKVLVQSEVIASRAAGPDASQPDADNDGLPDAYELLYAFLNKNTAADAAADADGDTLSNLVEYQLRTNPAHGDTDGDGLGDQTETMTGVWGDGLHRGTHPLSTDSDSDGLADGVETNTGVFVVAGNTGTNPNKPDTDGDGFNDGYEVSVADPGTSPVAPDFGGKGWQNLPDVTGPIPAKQHDSNWAMNSSFQPGDARYWATSNDGGGTWTIPYCNVWGYRSNFSWPGAGSVVTIGQGNNPTPPSTVVLTLAPVLSIPWNNQSAPFHWAGNPGALQLNRLHMNGGTLNFDGGGILAFDGDSIWAGGNAFAGQGGARYWNRGRLQITGNMTANHLLNTNIIRLTGGYLDVNGYANSGSGNLENRSSQAQFGGDPSVAEIRFEVDADLTSAPHAPGTIHNRGVIRKSGGTGVSTIAATLTNFDIGENNEDGVIDVQSGTVRIATTASPQFFGLDARVSSGAVLELGTVLPSNQPHYVTGTLRGSGAGKVRLTSWMQNMTWGPTNAPVPDGVLDFPAGMFEVAGGTFSQANGGKPVRNAGFVQVVGTSGVNGTFQNEHQLILLADLNGGGGLSLINGVVKPGSTAAVIDFQNDSNANLGVLNRGIVRKSGGSGVSLINGLAVTAQRLPGQPDSGRFEVSSGTLRTAASVTFEADRLDVSLANNSRMEITNGIARPNTGNSAVDNGPLPVTTSGTGVLQLSGQTYYRPLLRSSGSTVIRAQGAQLYGARNEGSLISDGSNWVPAGIAATNAGLVYVEGGGLSMTNFTNESTPAPGSPVSVPELRLVGVTALSGSSDLNAGLLRKINAGTAFLNLASFRNTGTIRVENGTLAITPGAFAYFHGDTFANGTLKEGRYEILSVLDTGNIPPYDPQLISTNQASILLSGAAASWPQLAALRNNQGTLEIEAGASLTTAPGQVFTNSGQLTLNGASLSVPDAATLNPPGTFSSHVSANPAAAGSTGRLTAAGALAVAGTLEVWVNLATAPSAATRWKIAQGSSRTGTFSTVRFMNLPAGWGGVVNYLADGVEVGLTPVSAANNVASWTAAQSFPSTSAALPLADPDNDGVTNLLEAAMGSNPRSAGTGNTAALHPVTRNGDTFLAFTYTRPGPASRPSDILYLCEQSADLSTWTCGTLVEEVSLPDISGIETVTVRQSVPAGSQPRSYLRLRIEKQ